LDEYTTDQNQTPNPFLNLVKKIAKTKDHLSLGAICIIMVFNIFYAIVVAATKKSSNNVSSLILVLYFAVIGIMISFIIYNLNYCFKPWLAPFKHTIARILAIPFIPKKTEIGKKLSDIMSDDDYTGGEPEIIKNNPFPLFLSVQSANLIDFLKYLDNGFKEDDNDNKAKIKDLYKTLIIIEKGANFVWVVLFAIFFSQTTVSYMNI
jgi:hypothetical protein